MLIKNTSCINCIFGNGLYFILALSNTLQNGVCDGNSGDGMYAYWLSNNNRIVNYTFNNNQGNGIYLLGSDNFIIKNCSANSNGVNGLFIGSKKNTIINCSSNSNGADGFFLYHSEGSKITNCKCSLNGGMGFYLKYSSENIIANNSLISNSDFGIKTDSNSASNQFYSNDLINNHDGKMQAQDNGSENDWDRDGLGNYWWDYPYFYPNSTNDGHVWDTPYELVSTEYSEDKYPLVEFDISQEEIERIHPGVLNDTDSDSVFDLIDDFPDDPVKFRLIDDTMENTYSLKLGPFLDEDNKSVVGAKVMITIDGKQYTNKTNDTGFVIIPLLDIPPDGEYHIEVTKEDYEALSFEFFIIFRENHVMGVFPVLKLKNEVKSGADNISIHIILIIIITMIIIIIIMFLSSIVNKKKGGSRKKTQVK